MIITPESSVGAIVAGRIGRARVFDRLGIDYCCHGTSSLGQACAERSLDLGMVLSALDASDERGEADQAGNTDFTAMPAGKLADHIIESHHAFLRTELPRLAGLIDRVVEAHGARHPEVHELRATFVGLRDELESHMLKEEWVLFPLIKRLETAQAAFPMHCGTVVAPIGVMEHEHASAGAALEYLRELTDGYRPPADACATLRAVYDGLDRLEADLRHHIHKENNILFPKAAALEDRLRTAGALAAAGSN